MKAMHHHTLSWPVDASCTSLPSAASSSFASPLRAQSQSQQKQQQQHQLQQQQEEAMMNHHYRLEELSTTISVMKVQEQKYNAIRRRFRNANLYNYYSTKSSSSSSTKSSSSSSPPSPTTKQLWRPMMIQWMYSVIDIFQLSPWIVPTALFYLDCGVEMLSTTTNISKNNTNNNNQYQLLGLTSIHMAIKVHETKVFPLEDLVQIGNSGFSCDQVNDMERQLVKALQWQLHPPTMECFLHVYVQVLFQQLVVLVNSTTGSNNLVSNTTSTRTSKVEHYRQREWIQLQVDGILSKTMLLLRQALLEELPFLNSIIAYAALLVVMEQEKVLQVCNCNNDTDKPMIYQTMRQLAGLSSNTTTNTTVIMNLSRACQTLKRMYLESNDLPSDDDDSMFDKDVYGLGDVATNTTITNHNHKSTGTPGTVTNSSDWEKNKNNKNKVNNDCDKENDNDNDEDDDTKSLGTTTTTGSNKTTTSEEIIYSAGEELGFEVTMCESLDDTTFITKHLSDTWSSPRIVVIE